MEQLSICTTISEAPELRSPCSGTKEATKVSRSHPKTIGSPHSLQLEGSPHCKKTQHRQKQTNKLNFKKQARNHPCPNTLTETWPRPAGLLADERPGTPPPCALSPATRGLPRGPTVQPAPAPRTPSPAGVSPGPQPFLRTPSSGGRPVRGSDSRRQLVRCVYNLSWEPFFR